jgi:C1A family cysteine protease
MANHELNLKELQALLASKNALWQAGESANAKLPDDQKEKNLGYVPGPREPSLRQRENISLANLSAAKTEGFSVSAIPAFFDWRNKNGNNYVTPVRNQGGCGSCVAFGSIANMETTYQIVKNNPSSGIDFSEAQLFYCYARSQGRVCGFHNESNAGWWVGPAMDSLKQGISDEKCYPYDGSKDQNCTDLCSDSASRSKKISGWHEITNINDMKTWIATKGPLTTCFTVYSDFYYHYESGIYHYTSGTVIGGHCVCVVGYSDADNGYWICKNSWGTGWGESGYFCIGYGEAGIDATMWAIDGIVDEGWLYSKSVGGLWAIDQNRNAWAYLNVEGWKKISNENDNIFYNMLSQLISAKASGRTVSVYISYGVIKQIYVNS